MKIAKLLLLFSLVVMISSCKDDESYPTYDPLDVTITGLKGVETPGEFVKTATVPATGAEFEFVVIYKRKGGPMDRVIVDGKPEWTRESGMDPDVTTKTWELTELNGAPDYKFKVTIFPNDTDEDHIFKFMMGEGRDYAKIRITQLKK